MEGLSGYQDISIFAIPQKDPHEGVCVCAHTHAFVLMYVYYMIMNKSLGQSHIYTQYEHWFL